MDNDGVLGGTGTIFANVTNDARHRRPGRVSRHADDQRQLHAERDRDPEGRDRERRELRQARRHGHGGVASLNGTVDVDNDALFVPPVVTALRIVDATTRTGTVLEPRRQPARRPRLRGALRLDLRRPRHGSAALGRRRLGERGGRHGTRHRRALDPDAGDHERRLRDLARDGHRERLRGPVRDADLRQSRTPSGRSPSRSTPTTSTSSTRPST